MPKYKITAPNVYGMHEGKFQKIPVGTIVEVSARAYAGRAEPVEEVEESKPEPELESDQANEETYLPAETADEEALLRDYIYEKTGKHPGGRSKIGTLRKKAAELGYEG